MAERNLLHWFEKRRESIIVSKTREHAAKVLSTALELDQALAFAPEGKKPEIKKALERLYISEKDADILEVRIHEELTKGELPSKEREDLMHMVRRMDYAADWTKEAGRNLEIVIDSDFLVPKDSWASLREMSKRLKMCAQSLKSAIDNFGVNIENVTRHQMEVEKIEHEMDDVYMSVKRQLVTSSMDAKAIIIMRDVLHAIENAADNCKDTADTIHILLIALGGAPGEKDRF